jgi:hypothetical protein
MLAAIIAAGLIGSNPQQGESKAGAEHLFQTDLISPPMPKK